VELDCALTVRQVPDHFYFYAEANAVGADGLVSFHWFRGNRFSSMDRRIPLQSAMLRGELGLLLFRLPMLFGELVEQQPRCEHDVFAHAPGTHDRGKECCRGGHFPCRRL
jgi:hypothetical protein